MIYVSNYRDNDFNPTEYTRRFGYRVDFKNSSKLEFNSGQQFVELFYDTDITFSDNKSIEKGGYKFYNTNIFYNSSPQKKLIID